MIQLLFLASSLVYSSHGVTVIGLRIPCCVVPNCPWHQNRKERGRWPHSPGALTTFGALPPPRCPHQPDEQQSHSVSYTIWARHSHVGPSNWLPSTQYVFPLWWTLSNMTSLTCAKHGLPAETQHPVSRRVGVGLFSISSGNRFCYLVCVISNQHCSSEGQSCHCG